ncbi:MAG: YraN family protein [Bacteroidetes bacterium]|nr:YraN family protein [Bacteroidota bacterium]
MAEHNETGKKGEQLAAEFLEQSGFQVLELNWAYQKYEIDIIAQKGDTLIVAEVKTRSGNYYGEPEAWVTKVKQKNLIKGAEAYIITNNLDLDVRFDILSIILPDKGEPKIHHTEDAFYPLL